LPWAILLRPFRALKRERGAGREQAKEGVKGAKSVKSTKGKRALRKRVEPVSAKASTRQAGEQVKEEEGEKQKKNKENPRRWRGITVLKNNPTTPPAAENRRTGEPVFAKGFDAAGR